MDHGLILKPKTIKLIGIKRIKSLGYKAIQIFFFFFF